MMTNNSRMGYESEAKGATGQEDAAIDDTAIDLACTLDVSETKACDADTWYRVASAFAADADRRVYLTESKSKRILSSRVLVIPLERALTALRQQHPSLAEGLTDDVIAELMSGLTADTMPGSTEATIIDTRANYIFFGLRAPLTGDEEESDG